MERQPKILYIDDERDLLGLVYSFFKDEAMEIETCNCFNEALEKIKNQKYDVIISDAGMPVGGGKELVQIIKQKNLFDGKFILVTGNLNYQEQEEQDQFDLVLFKPIKLGELVDRVKSMLAI